MDIYLSFSNCHPLTIIITQLGMLVFYSVTSVAVNAPLSSTVILNFLVLLTVEERKISSLSPSSTTRRVTGLSLAHPIPHQGRAAQMYDILIQPLKLVIESHD